MTMINERLEDLLTGSSETDARIQAAYALGKQVGRAQARESVRIDTTTRIIATLLRNTSMDLEKILLMLQLPKAEKKMHTNIFTKRQNKAPRKG